MVPLSPREQEVHDILYCELKPRELAAARLGIAIGTLNVLAFRVQKKHRAAGQPLPDKRRHFVTY